MKMYVLDNGVIRIIGDNKVTGGGTSDIPIHSFLFDTSEGYVLFDTGCDPDGMSGAWPAHMRANPYIAGENGYVQERLAQLGLACDDIRYVVMSHLHIDHAGGLKYFPNAEVIVSRAELCKTLRDYARRDFSGFHMQSDIESWLKAEIRWRPVPEDTEEFTLLPGLRILNFGPGHSYGMLGILAELDSGAKYLLAADTIYTKEHIGPPVQIAGIAYDTKGYVKTVERIVQRSQDEGAEILFGHDMEQFRTLTKSTEGYYD